jgi:H+/gluconate symporter-like permease
VIVFNKVFAGVIAAHYDKSYTMRMAGMTKPVTVEVTPLVAVWAVEGALILGILSVLALGWRNIRPRFAQGCQAAVSGSMLAAMNTASEYGFGAVIAALPGFVVVAEMLRSIPNPLINEAVTVTTLAGITGSASGGLSIALALMADTFLLQATTAGIPIEVLHRVASMASGGMDTLPHNGAVITLLMVSGLTHRQAYLDIFAITVLKTVAVLVIIGVFLTTGLV